MRQKICFFKLTWDQLFSKIYTFGYNVFNFQHFFYVWKTRHKVEEVPYFFVDMAEAIFEVVFLLVLCFCRRRTAKLFLPSWSQLDIDEHKKKKCCCRRRDSTILLIPVDADGGGTTTKNNNQQDVSSVVTPSMLYANSILLTTAAWQADSWSDFQNLTFSVSLDKNWIQ